MNSSTPSSFAMRFQGVAQAAVGRHAAADRQPLQPGSPKRLPAFRRQHIHDRLLKAGRQVGPALPGGGGAGRGIPARRARTIPPFSGR